ncbi:hypothetical protein [Methyloceanibacter sp. wino2]|uniref:hypothetical protein n=1 Tax=Methyloceanibacter sp. wino2 TaxID=2170729 RepID=UPI000D3E7B01|nr:hypothetical protein [Methyloceanibacter sp. wino2]
MHYSGLGKFLYGIYEKVPFLKTAFLYYASTIEPTLRSDRILSSYSKVMKTEFERIRPYLPEPLNVVLGIGPGIGGLEIYLSKYQRDRGLEAPKVLLLDKTGIDPIQYGFHEVAAVYNSLDLTRQSLCLNGHPPDRIDVFDAAEAEKLRDRYEGQVDLVTSLIAWGFHFPLETYLALVVDLLRPGGRVIVDVRRGTDGKQTLIDTFSDVQVIYEDDKFERVMAIR